MLSSSEAMRRARHFALIGNHAAAVEAWRDALTDDPSIAHAHAGLAQSLLALRRREGAAAEAKAALGLDPHNIQAMLVLVMTAWWENRQSLALQRLDHLLGVDPLAVEAHLLQAQLLRMQGRLDDALRSVDNALSLAPGDPAVLVERGWIVRGQGDGAEAETIARQRISQDPEDVGALVLLGHVRRDAGDADSARELALAALAVDPQDVQALDLLASAKLSQNWIGGLFWHLGRVLASMKELTRIAWLTVVYFCYLAVGTLMRAWDAPQIIQWSFILLWLFLGLGLYMNRMLIDWLVRRELKQVRLKPAF
jgi:tetratricopeptide (TPR) repeat protein